MPQQRSDSGSVFAVDYVPFCYWSFIFSRALPGSASMSPCCTKPTSLGLFEKPWIQFHMFNKFAAGQYNLYLWFLHRKKNSPFICAPHTFFASTSESSSSLHLTECTSWMTNTGKSGQWLHATQTPLMEVTKWTPSWTTLGFDADGNCRARWKPFFIASSRGGTCRPLRLQTIKQSITLCAHLRQRSCVYGSCCLDYPECCHYLHTPSSDGVWKLNQNVRKKYVLSGLKRLVCCFN